jgi:hypothetical protein
VSQPHPTVTAPGTTQFGNRIHSTYKTPDAVAKAGGLYNGPLHCFPPVLKEADRLQLIYGVQKRQCALIVVTFRGDEDVLSVAGMPPSPSPSPAVRSLPSAVCNPSHSLPHNHHLDRHETSQKSGKT